MLPVFFSVSTELADYKRFAEGLLDTFARALETSDSLATRLRGELQKWKLSKLSIGGVSLNRQGPEFLLSSGTAILRHALHDAWSHFIRPAQLKGAIFFLDDLHNFFYPGARGIALALRDQFQEFAIHGSTTACASPRAPITSQTSAVLQNQRCASTTRSISLLSRLRKQTNTPQPYSGIRSKSAIFPVGSMKRPSAIPIFWLS